MSKQHTSSDDRNTISKPALIYVKSFIIKEEKTILALTVCRA
ncbi:MAG: hypothetical protein PHE02_01745 [Lachnospiraceae bacterium]|nr:hypothetical protein [Lachnospiraceae bacterium]